MTTHSTLGPLMTLILTLTADGTCADNVFNPSPAGVVKSLLFARLLIETLRQKPVGYAKPSDLVFRIGTGLEQCAM